MRYVEVTTPKLLASRCGSCDASWAPYSGLWAILERCIRPIIPKLAEHFLLRCGVKRLPTRKKFGQEVQSFPSCLDDDAGPRVGGSPTDPGIIQAAPMKIRPLPGHQILLRWKFLCGGVRPIQSIALGRSIPIYIQPALVDKGLETGGPRYTGRGEAQTPLAGGKTPQPVRQNQFDPLH